jgi:hypothetical protein
MNNKEPTKLSESTQASQEELEANFDKLVRTSWNQHKTQFTEWWTKNSVEDRVRILNLVTNGTINSVNIYHSVIEPELNLKDLSEKPEVVVNLFKKYSKPNALEKDYKLLFKIYYGPDCPQKFILHQLKQFADCTIQTPDGEIFAPTANATNKHLQDLYGFIMTGEALCANVNALALGRKINSTRLISLIMDEFREEVLHKTKQKSISATYSVCQVCNAKVTKRCSACHTVGYCSRECQKKHWPEHKKVCKIHDKPNTGQTNLS